MTATIITCNSADKNNDSGSDLFEIKNFDFCIPRIWSSGTVARDKIILNVLCEPAVHDLKIIVKKFGLPRLISVWDHYYEFIQTKKIRLSIYVAHYSYSKDSQMIRIKACNT